MHISSFKVVMAISYVCFVAGIAPMMRLTSAAGWLAFAALTVTPLIVSFLLWKDPAETLSETIQSGKR